MKQNNVLLVMCIMSVSGLLVASEPKKPSVFSRVKGFFGKKKEESKPKDGAPQAEISTRKFILSICDDLKEFFKTGSEQITMFKNHPKVIHMVQTRITEISQQKEVTTDEEFARLTGQLDRLCAAPLSTFIELLQKVRSLTNHLQELFEYTHYSKEKGIVKEWLSKCDGVIQKGNTLVEELMKQKGKQSINEYLQKATEVYKSYKTVLSHIMNAINKIHPQNNTKSKIQFDYPMFLKLIPDKLEEIISIASHVTQLTTQLNIIVKNTQINSKVAQTEIKQIAVASTPMQSYKIGTMQETERENIKINDLLSTKKSTDSTHTTVKKTTIDKAPMQSQKIDTFQGSKKGSYKIDPMQGAKTTTEIKITKVDQEIEKETKKLEQEVIKAESSWGSIFNGMAKLVQFVPTFW